MDLTPNNFCPYIRNESNQLRLYYACSKTGKLCPHIDYRTGKARVGMAFLKNGCSLNKEKIIEEKKEKAKKIVKEEVIKTIEPKNTDVKEEVAEIVETIESENVNVKPSQNSQPRNNTQPQRKKRNNNNRK